MTVQVDTALQIRDTRVFEHWVAMELSRFEYRFSKFDLEADAASKKRPGKGGGGGGSGGGGGPRKVCVFITANHWS